MRRGGLLFAFACSAWFASAQSAEPIVLRVGLSQNAFRDTNINDAIAAYRHFLANIAERQGYKIRVETEVFPDRQSYATALNRRSNPIHLGIIMNWSYLQMPPLEAMRPTFTIAEEDLPGRHFVILARRDRSWSRLEDLQGKSLIWWELADTGVISDWVETRLGEANLPPAADFFASISTGDKPSTVVLPVFFGTKDACVIDEPSFKLMGELNPQVASQLQVLVWSQRLADAVICTRESDWPNEDFKKDILDALLHLDEDSDGRQILTLFKVRKIMPYNPEELDTCRELLARWQAVQAQRSS